MGRHSLPSHVASSGLRKEVVAVGRPEPPAAPVAERGRRDRAAGRGLEEELQVALGQEPEPPQRAAVCVLGQADLDRVDGRIAAQFARRQRQQVQFAQLVGSERDPVLDRAEREVLEALARGPGVELRRDQEVAQRLAATRAHDEQPIVKSTERAFSWADR